ncbi:FAD-binding domain-containing protein [Bimuria novae-zelandiae CBS 107.79]|uniref:FAD-binding domain-containing protein n=1 Tax=Bimuria novae-zelandiae CBS 107.79 TaxID=1447943 RepID=A0A6A5V760_9PLEO|nr:FAD-binding domain-containing protein [Bimuria novae-zelandiae CBS 107.79]
MRNAVKAAQWGERGGGYKVPWARDQADGKVACESTTFRCLRLFIRPSLFGLLVPAAEQANYWSTACGMLKLSCQLYPTSAEEIAAIVRILNANNETFAIKSGGHNPNQGFSSIDGGPLILTRELNEVIYDAASGTVRVALGNEWEDVIGALEGTGVTVAGGRIGDVGVGGLVLGGGLSFLSTQYGLVANNIGPTNYSIATLYTIKAHPQGQIWGGNIIYTPDKTPEILAAVRDFTEYYPDDKAGINITIELTQFGVIDMWLMFLFYEGPTPPAGVFDNFTAIAHLNTTESVINAAGLIRSIASQPIPKRLARKAKEMGGDLLDLDDDIDRIILEFDSSWLSTLDNKRMNAATQKLYIGSKNLVDQYQGQGKLTEAYLPLFANDAYYRQNYFGRLRTADFARRVRDEYDPTGFFASRTGGWKM